MDFISTQKHIIASPRKLREVVFLIKKMEPSTAVARLPFTGKRAAGELRKVIMTAIANAKVKGVNANELDFKEIQIGEGPRLKRYRAGSRGRAKPYKRRMSHIRIVLKTKEVKNSVNEEPKKLKVEKPNDEKAQSEVKGKEKKK